MTHSPTFRGVARLRILTELLDSHRAVVQSRRPRLLLLVGPSGSGKTRLAREFYDRLVQDSAIAGNRYWPMSDGSEPRDALGAVLGGRHRPTFFFWQIEGGDPDWSLERQLGRQRSRVRSVPFLMQLGWRSLGVGWASLPLRSRLREWRKELRAELMQKLAERALKSSTPPLVLFLIEIATEKVSRKLKPWLSRTRVHVVVEWYDEQSRKVSGRMHEQVIGSTEALLERLARDLPTVIFVDNLHKASGEQAKDLHRLLIALLAARTAVLVVATAPSAPSLASRPGLGDLLRRDAAYFRDVIDLGKPLNQLAALERQEIIAEACPMLRDDVQVCLAAKYEADLHLLLRKVRDPRFQQEAEHMTLADLDHFADDEQEDLQQRWARCSPEWRPALELAVLASPSAFSQLFPNGISWDGSLPAAAAADSSVPKLRIRRESLEELHGGDPPEHLSEWIRRSDANAWEWRCSEPSLFEWVLRQATANYAPVVGEYRSSLARVAERIPVAGDEARERARARLLVAIAASDPQSQPWTEAAIGAADLLITIARRDDDFDLARKVYNEVCGHDQDSERALRREQRVQQLMQLQDRRLLDRLSRTRVEWPATPSGTDQVGPPGARAAASLSPGVRPI